MTKENHSSEQFPKVNWSQHVLAHENSSSQRKLLSSNFLYSLPAQNLQTVESVREMSCQINSVRGLHTPELEKAWQKLSCLKVSSRNYAIPGKTIPPVNGNNKGSSQHVSTNLEKIQTPQNSHKINAKTGNPDSFMGYMAHDFPPPVSTFHVQTSCTVQKESVDAATNNIAEDDILANIDLDQIIMEHSQSTCTPQPKISILRPTCTPQPPISNLRPILPTVHKSSSARPEEYCLPPELCLICSHGCKLGVCLQGANHLQEMKDTLIAVSNELLDNVGALSPTKMEKLRQDRLLLNKKIQQLETHLRTVSCDEGRQYSHFSASTATPIASQYATPYERGNERPVPFASVDKSGFQSVFMEREPYVPKYIDINYIEGSNDMQWSSRDFPWTKILEANNKKVFGNQSFRPIQREVINATMSGNDVFVLMPTGGGKSLTYQLPALICPGLTLVISPLVSLIQDQIMHLLQANIPATYLSSNMEWTEQQDIFRDIISENCKYKMLYVTPEKIAKSDALLRHLESIYARESLSRIVIDEAHCVSQWGHDFRPDYQALGILKQKFPNTPVLALTATATASVKEDVVQALGLVNCIVFRLSFNRPNLNFSVIHKTKKCVDDIHKFIKQYHDDECGIIYCLSRMDCEKVSEKLQDYGHKVAFYHGSMDPAQRTFVQKQWSKDEINIICATVAFGMGINKPDVRFVIHHSIPKSIEGYHQECGRAGRDGQNSSCVLFYNYSDYIRIKLMISQGGVEQSPMSSRYNRNNNVVNSGRSFETNSENILRMVSYCENDVDCRRFLQLVHLGEKFDSAMCKKTCDNCSKLRSFVEKDVTEIAKQLVDLVRLAGQRFSSAHILEVYWGSLSQLVKKHKHDTLRLHGAGRHVAKPEASRVLRHLVTEEYLFEDVKKSDLYGSVSSVLRVNESMAPKLFSVGQKIILRIPSVGKASKLSSSEVTPAKGALTPQSQTQGKDVCLSTKIFHALLRLRSDVSDAEGCDGHHVFHRSALIEISNKIPRRMEELLEIKGIANVKFERYGARVLETIESTINEYFKTEKNSSSGSSNESMKRRREGRAVSDADMAVENLLGEKNTVRSKKRPIKSQNSVSEVHNICLDDELDFGDDLVSEIMVPKAKPSGGAGRMLPAWPPMGNKAQAVDAFEKYSFKR